MDHLLADYGSCSSDSNSSVHKNTRESPNNSERPSPSKRRKTNSDEEGLNQNSHSNTAPTRQVSILTETQARDQSVFVRNDPHIRGNWAGSVYLSLGSETTTKDDDSGNESTSTCEGLDQWIQDSAQRVQQWMIYSNHTQQKKSALVIHDYPHISLTRSFYLQKAFIPSFLQRLQSIVQCHDRLFRVILSRGRIQTLRNDARQRTFFAWPIQCSSASRTSSSSSTNYLTTHTLTNWTQALDQLLRDYQQPVYYNPPLFHATFASTPGDWPDFPEDDESSSTNKTTNNNTKNTRNHHYHQSCGPQSTSRSNALKDREKDNPTTRDRPSSGEDDDEWEVWITHVHCRLGNQTHTFPLGKKNEEGNAIEWIQK